MEFPEANKGINYYSMFLEALLVEISLESPAVSEMDWRCN
jgi:hypothetical protein